MKKLIFLLCLLFVPCCLMAQNAVDETVENLKTVGSSHFTSAIERDPQTHQPLRVVKRLEVGTTVSKRIISVFDKEAARSCTEKSTKQNGVIKRMFLEEKADQIRIYSIEYPEHLRFPDVKLTIIVKYNTK